MRYRLLFLLCLFFSFRVAAQERQKSWSLALTNNHTAFPFTRLGGLFYKEFHPGLELGYSFNWRTKPRHDLFQTVRAGYFFHRYIQHALPLYTQFGYRYKPGAHWGAHAALGAGYLHSVPASAMHSLNENGEYESAKGIGRGQALFSLAIGARYRPGTAPEKGPAFFLEYRQQLQAPFIRSYVPLLPYSSMALGVTLPIKNK